ncbi:MAG: hypothetical protein RMK18_07535 [Armatimonadota bacterium]|nr:hypothetical protein [Armatimonadota bacterium]
MSNLTEFALSVMFATAILVSLAVSLLSSQGEKVVAEWQFDREGDLQGWQPNVQIKDVKVANGILSFRTEGYDPILFLEAPFEIHASPWNVIEIRLKADGDGVAEFFWSNTYEEPYRGFRPHKRTEFWVTGDGKWRTYRILPLWHPEGKIIRLRFDPFGGANFEIDFIRIVELEAKNLGLETGWVAVGDASVRREKEGWTVTTKEPDALILTPVSIDAEANSFVSIQMAVRKGDYATLYFATEKEHGFKRVSISPLIADGKEHIYNLDMIAYQEWRGRIIALGLRPTDKLGETVRLSWVSVSDRPKGLPDLRIPIFALDDASPRVGITTSLIATVTNSGGETAKNVRAKLILPKGVELKGDASLSVEQLG